jgi:anion-transporting  ArsA/GET3 family ATPase
VKVDQLLDRAVVICCGTGGVGKTTTAAAIALEAARRGRLTCVVTIDPAKRLANTLGLTALSDTPTEIARERWDPAGESSGTLFALMLDTKSTFDRVIARYAGDPEQAARILDNRFYRNVSGALGGTQEYMAMEKLHELHADGNFDFIVVDTPPTRHALDFVDAPARLLRLLDNRVFRLLMMPTRAYLKVASVAVQGFLRTVARVVGRDVIDDVVAFFRAFEGMEAGFRERAESVQQLIADPDTAFVLVTTPRRDAVDEADYFARRLVDHRLEIDALIVNRVHPSFTATSSAHLVERAATLGADPDLARRYLVLAELQATVEREHAELQRVVDRLGNTSVAMVPLLSSDVHDLTSLGAIGRELFAGGPSEPGDAARRG